MLHITLIFIIIILFCIISILHLKPNISENFSMGFLDAKKQVNKLIENKKIITKQVNQLRKYIENGYEIIKKVTKIKNMINLIKNMIKEVLNQIKKLNFLKEEFINFFKNIQNQIPGLNNFKNVLNNIKIDFNDITNGFKDIENGWKNRLKDIENQVNDMLKKINSLGNLGSDLGGVMLNGLKNMGSAVTDISNQVGQEITRLANIAGNIINAGIGVVAVVGKDSLKNVGNFGSNSIGKISNFGSNIVNNIGNIASSFFGKRKSPCGLPCYSPQVYKDFRGTSRVFRIFKMNRKHSDRACNFPEDFRLEDHNDRIRTVFHNGCRAQVEILYPSGIWLVTKEHSGHFDITKRDIDHPHNLPIYRLTGNEWATVVYFARGALYTCGKNWGNPWGFMQNFFINNLILSQRDHGNNLMLSQLRKGNNFQLNFKIWMYKAIKKMTGKVIERRIGGHLYQFRKLEENRNNLINREISNKNILNDMLRRGTSTNDIVNKKIELDNQLMNDWIQLLDWFDARHGAEYMDPKSSEAQHLANLFLFTRSDVQQPNEDYGRLYWRRQR